MDHQPPNPDGRRESDLAHLAASIGHHVINAFSAIVSNAEVLKLTSQAREDGEEDAATAEIIMNVALKASDVARRLIDFTRPATKPGSETVDLPALLADIVAEKAAAWGPGTEWSVDVGRAPPMVGLADQLRAMFGMILENAGEALGPEGGRITISAREDEPGWVSLLIEDTGRGMVERVHEQALEPFFSTKPGHQGIGLCLANSIWRRHGGTMAIQSEPGRGTVVRMTIATSA